MDQMAWAICAAIEEYSPRFYEQFWLAEMRYFMPQIVHCVVYLASDCSYYLSIVA